MRLLFLFQFVTVLVFSQEKLESSLLWKIEGKQFTQPVYVFGTMHLISEEAYYFPKKLEKLIAKSDEIILEIADIDANALNISSLMLKEGSMLDPFGEAQKDSIYQWIENELNLSKENFNRSFGRFKPIIIVQLAAQKSVGLNAKSYEKTIASIADKKKVTIKGFETIDQQIGFFDSLSTEASIEMVMESIRPTEDDSISIKLEECYRSQDIDALYSLIHQSESSISDHEGVFLEKRNLNWLKDIETLDDKKLFIAVGAGHLGGKNGLIRLLQNKGYTLTPVNL